ncbi:MmcQ/YjbR family DNA-binding protein [uncultured Sphingomonas sp.]|uniref:MmcQ/YjbR family DNA-binding protein n=1 Tax=uncultured Sphingomonas sp. TaxID=158754 RepID=UPI0025FA64AB|nr:MmcQ/YjbR family DNA-binding protein [uncultured Sphingomonas sp.]
MNPDHDGDLERLRAIALALPGAEERESHGAPGFHIEDGKFFAYFRHDHHGDGETAVLVKTTGADEMATLIDADPALYFKPAYLGPSGWIAIRTDAPGSDWDHIGDRIAQSWEMVAPRRYLEAGGR